MSDPGSFQPPPPPGRMFLNPVPAGGEYWIGPDGKRHLVPRGLAPNNFELSQRWAAECGVEWDPSKSPYKIGGPLWAVPRAQEEYPKVEGVEVCDECGYQHVTIRGLASCKSHRYVGKSKKIPCRKLPLKDGHVTCKTHHPGNHGKAAARRVAEKQAAKSLAKVKVVPIGNPIDHLSELAAEALAIKSHFADVVAELRQIGSPVGWSGEGDEPSLADFLNRRDDHGYRFTDDKGAEQLDARVQLYERALDRAEKFLVNLVKLDFEERRTRLDEARVLLVMEFAERLIVGLGHDVHDPQVEALVRSIAPILDGGMTTQHPIEVGEAEAS